MTLKTCLLASAIALGFCSPALAEMKFGYSTMDLTNPYFIALTNGMKDRASELGIALTVHDSKSDAALQVSAVENFLVQKMDAIIVSPIDPNAIEPMVEQIHAAGIPLINPNQEIKGADAFISLDEHNYGLAIGRVAGQYIVDNMGGTAQVALFTFPEITSVIARGEGIRDGILEVAPDANIVSEQSASTPEAGARATEAIMQAHPDVRVIAGFNDAGILGAYEAIAGMGLPTEEFALFGLDATEEAVTKIKAGSMYKGTVDINPYGTGQMIIDTAVQVIESGPITGMIEMPMEPVTEKTLTN
ncbi:sugar ABC transporter substrate-binding protein [Pseudoruegeria sp. SK021]|uniref:sugar ABC transporter substrate-binding protein n=1 Tax=Pseudoruegeria sp. SK021 TaxID=1933035 RepID=UPI000A256D35|nr:sugar ABC transporter substrate-binding protein [Pseudoruegeria sp. SK021]OSP53448.1 hypothetical protein BV911_17925 [Pseudoruegeria sp. SK021]